ncbi:MAG: PhoX family phosphatase [Vicinamibacteria bacterium]
MELELEDDAVCNPSDNEELRAVVEVSLTRRQILQGALGAAAVAFIGGPKAVLAQSASRLGFASVAVSQEDQVLLPEGYTHQVVTAWGDPVSGGPRWDPSSAGTSDDQAAQMGMHADGVHFFSLPQGSNSSSRGILCVNNEYTDEGLLHQGGLQPITADKVRKSQAAHGVTIVEVSLNGDRWDVVRPSAFGRRITAYTPMRFAGPAAGHPLLQTSTDPAGLNPRGTLNNCAMGATPWGTYLTCEENFNQYFGGGPASAAQTPGQRRYGLPSAASTRGWETQDGRFAASREPNEFNRFGWVVEIDPFDASSTPVKHTALGRIAHEGATVTLARDGRVVVYMGDDSQNEYIYQFVSRDAYTGNRAAASSLLDSGTLYVGKFASDGSGQWVELTQGLNGLDVASGFASQADVVTFARLAADRVGATKMDRPEWIAVHPQTGELYVTLTNNTTRGTTGGAVDGANPRANNVFGHIVRWTETGSDAAATTFRWNVFVLAGDPRSTDVAKRGNIKGDAFGSPDGLWIDGRGVLWIQTDISTSAINAGDYANIGNNMMLAADPATGEIKRFLTGPRGCELTGVHGTPDGRSLFVSIQHPGEPASGDNNPNNRGAISTWPDGPGVGVPRSATIVIRRTDGGVVGS